MSIVIKLIIVALMGGNTYQIFSPGLLRVPVVCLIFHSSVVTMSQEHSLSK